MRIPAALLLLWAGLSLPSQTHAHGGVAFEDDLCVINIGFLRAHFTIFQPEDSDREFCEDVPKVSRSIFIMEYLHDLLRTTPVDFRIIRDATGFGRFANWNDIQALDDLEAVTVYYQPPQTEPSGYFRAAHSFKQRGDYIGIVTARHPETNRLYNAVFYFHVGGYNLRSPALLIPLITLLAAFFGVLLYFSHRR